LTNSSHFEHNEKWTATGLGPTLLLDHRAWGLPCSYSRILAI